MRKAYMIEHKNPLVWVTCILMLLAAGARTWHFWGDWHEMSTYTLIVQVVLPLACCLLYALLLPLCGSRALWTTALPVLFGTVFFALKAQTFSKTHMLLCLLLYLTVAVLYTCTVTGLIPTQKLLIPLFGLPLLYHMFVEDLHTLRFAVPPLTFYNWLPEISVLLIMAALLSAALAMKKKSC